jgi:1-acyl-sn-glycerol-3-phosphate acyltransferase
LRRWLDIRVWGMEHLPEGGFVMVNHHCVYFDSSILGVVLDRKAHGWIDARVFRRLFPLCHLLELVPVRTHQRAGKDVYMASVAASVTWMKRIGEPVGLTNDGNAEDCLDEQGHLLDLEHRANHSGAAVLALEAQVPVVAVSMRVPEPYARELLVSRGLASLRYMERHRRIPCDVAFSEPIPPGQFAGRRELREDIRRRQIVGLARLHEQA